MIGARMRMDLDRYADAHEAEELFQDEAREDDDNWPSMVFAAVCALLSAAISLGLIVWAIERFS